MVVVAVAGGTSPALGRSIVTALHFHPAHIPIVLSRNSMVPQWLFDLGVEIRRVNYLSLRSLTATLKGVHTVISLLKPLDDTWAFSQINLLNAAIAVGAKRFAPSEFAIGPKAAEKMPEMAPRIGVWQACEAAVEDQRKNGHVFEWCRFVCGMFMNYLGYGCEREEEAMSGKGDDGEFLFFQRDGTLRVEIPIMSMKELESGERKVPRIVLTEIGDMGRFVAAACALPDGKWEVDMGMAGSVMRIDEVVRVIEEVRKRKMEVKYVEMTELEVRQKELQTKEDFIGLFWNDLAMMYARDEEGEGYFRARVNELCPEVKALTVKKYMEKFWD
ncbi:NAD(P)-binding protein [Rhizodiscina lignyota]|uniref:NAD(P)-binding protein n=1 Tax=Rhizodiscina lignyota TaxID=1504668 RepID=A0A9P4IAH4_9PEZI|nr:NAD(P)-binding protein [Rhizodiscina lignyota]